MSEFGHTKAISVFYRVDLKRKSDRKKQTSDFEPASKNKKKDIYTFLGTRN